MKQIPEIACVNVVARLAITEDGQSLPVTNAFDEDGDECEIEDAVAIVAGPDRDGMWLTIDFRAFDAVTVQ